MSVGDLRANPRLAGGGDLARLLLLLAAPDGLQRIVAEIEEITAASNEAYARLEATQQREAAHRVALLDQRERELAAKEADLKTRGDALLAAVAALAVREAAVGREEAGVARARQAAEAAQAKAEKGAADAAAETERLRVRLTRLRAIARDAVAPAA